MNEKFNVPKLEEKEEPKWLEKIRRYYSGEMHSHSSRSDRSELGGVEDGILHRDERLLLYAEKLGLDFVVFSEHASNPGKPEELSDDHQICESLLAQQNEIDEINNSGKYKPKAFSSVEASVLFSENGEAVLDVPNSVLSKMDIVVASRHGIDHQRDPEQIEKSLLAIIKNEDVDIVGHPYRYIEFYENDWNYFKKYYRKDPDIYQELSLMEKNKQGDSIKQIIGKTPVTDIGRIAELNEKFTKLKNEYDQMWDNVLLEMEEQGKAFEINLNVFDPKKSFYKDLLKKAVSFSDLNFTIAFDFHNLSQAKKFKEEPQEKLSEIKNPGRRKAVQRLLNLVDLLEELGLSEDRVVNSSSENFKKFLKQRKSN